MTTEIHAKPYIVIGSNTVYYGDLWVSMGVDVLLFSPHKPARNTIFTVWGMGIIRSFAIIHVRIT